MLTKGMFVVVQGVSTVHGRTYHGQVGRVQHVERSGTIIFGSHYVRVEFVPGAWTDLDSDPGSWDGFPAFCCTPVTDLSQVDLYPWLLADLEDA